LRDFEARERFGLGRWEGHAVAPSDEHCNLFECVDEVVVTARRKEEKAQTVPITMTTFSQSAIENQNITNVDQLYRDTPGIASCCGSGQSSFAFIRGVLGSQTYFGGAPTIRNSNSRCEWFQPRAF